MSDVNINLGTFRFRGVWAIVAAVVILLVAGGWVLHRRSSLEEQGRKQVEEYLELELPAREFRERGGRGVSASRLRQTSEFEIVEFSVPFYPRDRCRVRVRIAVDGTEETFYFLFRRTLGEWQLRHETRAGVLDFE